MSETPKTYKGIVKLGDHQALPFLHKLMSPVGGMCRAVIAGERLPVIGGAHREAAHGESVSFGNTGDGNASRGRMQRARDLREKRPCGGRESVSVFYE